MEYEQMMRNLVLFDQCSIPYIQRKYKLSYGRAAEVYSEFKRRKELESKREDRLYNAARKITSMRSVESIQKSYRFRARQLMFD